MRVRLFGAMEVRLEQEALRLPRSARARALLAYLLLHRGVAQPRQRVAFLLWPDSTDAQARTNLRHLLHTLQRASPELVTFLDVGPEALRWRPDASCWVDVEAFEEALERVGRAGGAAVAALTEAVDLYRGDLLEGCFDEWIEPVRSRLRRSWLAALGRLAEQLAAQREHAEAIRRAEELLAHDPADEAAWRLLMRAHQDRGDEARAALAYRECVAALARELGVEPSAETRHVYQALRPNRNDRGSRARHGAAAEPPLVGRSREWSQLTSLWRAADAGRARLVLITGEAGIGKTRLLEELRSWCAGRGVVTAEARSYRAEGSLAYGVVSSWLQSTALRAGLDALDPSSLSEVGRLLPEIHSHAPELPSPEPLPGDAQRIRLYAAIARAIRNVGAPTLLVADDLQWCDRESLQLLHHLLRGDPCDRLMVAATVRREELTGGHPLSELLLALRVADGVTEIELARLGPDETGALAASILGRSLTEAEARRLHDDTEGSPLFVLEALRAGWQAEGEKARWSSPRVQAVIEYRLGQLSPAARHLAEVAAVCGREFTADVLGQAADMEGQDLVRALDELWERGIIRERDPRGYDFSHDKIREVAYLALAPARRRHHHFRLARALERAAARIHGQVAAQIAAHYERAGATDEAIAWYGAAADAAQRRYANSEASRLLGRALELQRALPATGDRDAGELAILTALLNPLSGAEGWASQRLSEVQRRAIELSRSLSIEPSPQLWYSLALASLARDDFDAAKESGARLRARAREEGDDSLMVESDYVLGIAAFWHGELIAARAHFEAAVNGYRPEWRRGHLLHFWLDPQVVCQSRLGNTLLLLGEPEAAVRARDDALALAEEVSHPFSRATTLVFAAYMAVEMDDTERLREYVAALEAEPYANDLPAIRITIDVLRAYLGVLDGQTGPGIAAIRTLLSDPAGVQHAPGMRPVFLRLLLCACTVAGDTQGRLAAAEDLLRLGGAARHFEAEAHRARAECLAELGAAPGTIESELRTALEVARRQGARLLERRAEESLRHWQGDRTAP